MPIVESCETCGGTGRLAKFLHYRNGLCFDCKGKGYIEGEEIVKTFEIPVYKKAVYGEYEIIQNSIFFVVKHNGCLVTESSRREKIKQIWEKVATQEGEIEYVEVDRAGYKKSKSLIINLETNIAKTMVLRDELLGLESMLEYTEGEVDYSDLVTAIEDVNSRFETMQGAVKYTLSTVHELLFPNKKLPSFLSKA